MDKAFLTPEQLQLLKTGNVIETPSGETYYNFPFWVKEINQAHLELLMEKVPNVELYSRSEVPVEKSYTKGGLKKLKYFIQKADGTPIDPQAWYFVLRVDKDPHAKVAALAYADSVEAENPLLAKELREKIHEFYPAE